MTALESRFAASLAGLSPAMIAAVLAYSSALQAKEKPADVPDQQASK